MTHKLAIVGAGVRRFLVVLGTLSALTAAGALALTALGGWDANRALSVAFDIVGMFFLVAGFFVGNRGPVRGNDGKQSSFLGMRSLHWASPSEREETLNSSAMFVALGFALIALGILTDGRYPIL